MALSNFRRISQAIRKQRNSRRVASVEDLLDVSHKIWDFRSADHLDTWGGYFDETVAADPNVRGRRNSPRQSRDEERMYHERSRSFLSIGEQNWMESFLLSEIKRRVELLRDAILKEMDEADARDMRSYNLAGRRQATCPELFSPQLRKAAQTLGILNSDNTVEIGDARNSQTL